MKKGTRILLWVAAAAVVLGGVGWQTPPYMAAIFMFIYGL